MRGSKKLPENGKQWIFQANLRLFLAIIMMLFANFPHGDICKCAVASIVDKFQKFKKNQKIYFVFCDENMHEDGFLQNSIFLP